MSISSVSNGASPYTQGLQPSQISDALKQRKQDFTALSNALQSGDIAGAQKAFSAMQQDTQTIRQFRSGQGGDRDGDNDGSKAVQAGQSGQNSKTSMQDLMKSLKQALSSGDLQGAQQAFATLQQNMQANQGHRHHHHGGGAQPAASSAVSSAASTSTISTTA
jgi:ribosomal protein S20